MYISDFEDFYSPDESEFPENIDTRNDFDEEDDFENFEEFTGFEDLDDLEDDNAFRSFEDTNDVNKFNKTYDVNNNSFMCPMMCPFYRQFHRQMPPPKYGGARQMDRPPSGPPPSTAPVEPLSATSGVQTFVDSGSIRMCRFKFAYIWPRRGNGFWMWITYVGRTSIAGWRWDGRRWFRFGMDVREIRSFRC